MCPVEYGKNKREALSAEVGDRKSEIGSRRSEVGERRTEVRIFLRGRMVFEPRITQMARSI